MINKKKNFHMQDGYKDEIFYIKISEKKKQQPKTELGNLKIDERGKQKDKQSERLIIDG